MEASWAAPGFLSQGGSEGARRKASGEKRKLLLSDFKLRKTALRRPKLMHIKVVAQRRIEIFAFIGHPECVLYIRKSLQSIRFDNATSLLSTVVAVAIVLAIPT